MKQTLTSQDFVDAFRCQRPDQFTPAALRALFDHLEECEKDTGEEYELDVIALCCDFTEYASASEAAMAYGWEEVYHNEGDERSLNEDAAEEWLMEQTTVICFDGGIVVQNF